MKRFLVIISLLLSLFVLVSCNDKGEFDESYSYDGTSLIGAWQQDGCGDNDYRTYEFYEDGRVICKACWYGVALDTVYGTYTVVDGNTMEIVYGNDDFERDSTNRFSITNEGNLIILALDERGNEIEIKYTPYNKGYNEEAHLLVGTWRFNENQDEYYTFNSDMTGVIGGDSSYSFKYSTKDGVLYLLIEFIDGVIDQNASSIAFKYEINGSTLTFEIGDEPPLIQEFTKE